MLEGRRVGKARQGRLTSKIRILPIHQRLTRELGARGLVCLYAPTGEMIQESWVPHQVRFSSLLAAAYSLREEDPVKPSPLLAVSGPLPRLR